MLPAYASAGTPMNETADMLVATMETPTAHAGIFRPPRK
jgi:hypothetical protein